jgi:hypothetical protein
VRLLKGIHWVLRLVGFVAVVALIALGLVSYLSPSLELTCDAFHKFERERAGKTYHCLIG